ncbi:MAG: hypothetical protein SGPRY_005986, partial [Prymnesium sp.]
DAALLPDLRSIHAEARKDSTCFEEFWSCVQAKLDGIVVVAEEKRHGGEVAYLSKVVSIPSLYRAAAAIFETRVKEEKIPPVAKLLPVKRWFGFNFSMQMNTYEVLYKLPGSFRLAVCESITLTRTKAQTKQKSLVHDWVQMYRQNCTAD